MAALGSPDLGHPFSADQGSSWPLQALERDSAMAPTSFPIGSSPQTFSRPPGGAKKPSSLPEPAAHP